MVLNIAMAALAAFVTMYVTASVFRVVGFKGWGTFFGQLFTVGILAITLIQAAFISSTVGIGLIALVIVLRVFAVLWFWWLAKRILDGAHGEGAKWAAELAKEGDDEFIEAVDMLSEVERQEIGIIADSKEELRELAVEEAGV